MIDNLGALLLGIIIGAVASIGVLAWWDSRRDDHAAEDAAREPRECTGSELCRGLRWADPKLTSWQA